MQASELLSRYAAGERDFRWANLSGANLGGANLSGADLSGANLGGANLSGADLSGANLGGANLSGANLSGANLGGANLSGANLGGANLSGANLGGANLGWANLSGANLSGALGLPQSAHVDHLDARILAVIESGEGRLDMERWHTCETTHCRAGFAIRQAGPAGAVLEELFGPSAAGAIIYGVSVGIVPDFMASDEDALADMRRAAALDPLPAAVE